MQLLVKPCASLALWQGTIGPLSNKRETCRSEKQLPTLLQQGFPADHGHVPENCLWEITTTKSRACRVSFTNNFLCLLPCAGEGGSKPKMLNYDRPDFPEFLPHFKSCCLNLDANACVLINLRFYTSKHAE